MVMVAGQVTGLNDLEVSAVVATGPHTMQVIAVVPEVVAQVRASGKVTTLVTLGIDPLIKVVLESVLASMELTLQVDMAQLDVTNEEKTALTILEKLECNQVNIGITGEIDIDVSDLPSLAGLEEALGGIVASAIQTRIPNLLQEHCGGLIKDTLNGIMLNAKRRSELNPARMTRADIRDELQWMQRRQEALEAELANRTDSPVVGTPQASPALAPRSSPKQSPSLTPDHTQPLSSTSPQALGQLTPPLPPAPTSGLSSRPTEQLPLAPSPQLQYAGETGSTLGHVAPAVSHPPQIVQPTPSRRPPPPPPPPPPRSPGLDAKSTVLGASPVLASPIAAHPVNGKPPPVRHVSTSSPSSGAEGGFFEWITGDDDEDEEDEGEEEAGWLGDGGSGGASGGAAAEGGGMVQYR